MAMSVRRHYEEEGLKKIVLHYTINAEKKEGTKKFLKTILVLGIPSVHESNAVHGLRRAFVGLQNTKINPQAYRQLPCTTRGLKEHVSSFLRRLYNSQQPRPSSWLTV
jgi:hypothetical protein